MEQDKELSILLKDYYSNYASYIVYNRAIPLLNDGLKPVQRRVLCSMDNLKLYHNKQSRKSAKIIGDTIGQYHPHSLDGPYGALVNMAASYSSRYPLAIGVGNFGSIQDNPAASRYTESKMSQIGELLFNDTQKDVAEYIPNYDNTSVEPISLCGLFPNILCNSTNGIAAGIASSIPSHNATEVYTALIKTIDRVTKGKDIDTNFLMKYIKGPDFPLAGIITNVDEIEDVYKNGKGKFTIRGEYTIKDKNIVEFTSIPYGASFDSIISGLAKLREQKLCGSVKNLSAKGGICLQIKPARGQSVDQLIKILFKKTKLENNFNSQFVMIHDGKVCENLPLTQIIKKLILHYYNVVKKRHELELSNNKKALERHNAMLTAIKNSEVILETIKTSTSPKEDLIKILNVNENIAIFIMGMRIQDFTKVSQDDLNDKIKKLEKRNKELTEILKDSTSVLLQVKSELQAILKTYFKGDKRLTKIGVESDAKS